MAATKITSYDTFNRWIDSFNDLIDTIGGTSDLGDSSDKFATTEYVQNRHHGVLTKNLTGFANVTLTSSECGHGIIIVTGAMTTNCNVIVPNAYNHWILYNLTSGGKIITFKTSTGVGLTTRFSHSPIFAVCDSTDVRGISGDALKEGVFLECDSVLTTSYTITEGKNALTAGPITIGDGVEVQIPSGSVWTVL